VAAGPALLELVGAENGAAGLGGMEALMLAFSRSNASCREHGGRGWLVRCLYAGVLMNGLGG